MQSTRWEDTVRASVRGDFPPKEIKAGKYIRVVSVGGEYLRFRSFFIGKLMKVERAGVVGWVCSFVYENDRAAINKAAGYTYKRLFLLEELKAKVL